MILQDALEKPHVGQPRDAAQRQDLVGQEGRDHERQSGILGAADRNSAGKPVAAADTDTVHLA